MKRLLTIVILLIASLILSQNAFAAAKPQPFDHSTWDTFLKKFVNENGEVDYSGVKKEPKLLKQYLKQVRAIKPNQFEEWPREEKLALWINVYHAGLIKTVTDYYPVANIQQISGVWQIQSIYVAKTIVGLDEIRKNKLLQIFHDEKIHTVLACGAKSCPKLSREAYTGPKVEGQLFVAARNFVNDPELNTIAPGSRKIWISKIFKWYQADFLLDFGVPENDRGMRDSEYAVLSFIANYLDDADKSQFLEEGYYKIKYKAFDWRLNDWKDRVPDPVSE